VGLRALIVWAALLLVALPATAEPTLSGALDASLGVRGLRGARVAALVVDAEAGQVLFARDADRAMVPASNLKVLTALAALEALGPTHRFVTHVFADAPLDAEGAVDWLYVQGGGDPSLTSESWWRLCADLRLAGLRKVRSGIVYDDSVFDSVRWHPSWGRVSSRAYYAPVGALGANYGAFTVEAQPGVAPGDPVRVTLDPPVDSLRVVNRARTGSQGGRASLRVDRVVAGDVEEVRLSGSVPAGGKSRRVYRSVADPARYAAAVARLQLSANGISVGPAQIAGPVPAGASELLAFEGRRLAEVVRLLIKYSNNGIAESLVKALGAARDGKQGSWANGTVAIRERLAGLGLDPKAFSLVDGSGLSKHNRVSPRVLVEALQLARGSFAVGPELVAALPIGARDGTLKKRADAAGERVRAKTGLLDSVTGLSGYAELSNGRDVVFSILVNGYRAGDEAAMGAVDGFVAALVNTPLAGIATGRAADRAAWTP
jgi:D-alanyl-D-alanine carboxypeptidase/D-alanyl-D-alanine-endopeptidase (penicillin-binding protein 4)